MQKEYESNLENFNNIERNFGLKVHKMNEYEDDEEEGNTDHNQDLELFKEVQKTAYDMIKRTHRDTMGTIRMRERKTFLKLGQMKPKTEQNAYNQINMQVDMMK